MSTIFGSQRLSISLEKMIVHEKNWIILNDFPFYSNVSENRSPIIQTCDHKLSRTSDYSIHTASTIWSSFRMVRYTIVIKIPISKSFFQLGKVRIK